MPEAKTEVKELKSPDLARIVSESVGRLHEMERRLHNVQTSLASLTSMTGIQPTAIPTLFAPDQQPMGTLPAFSAFAPSPFGTMQVAPGFGNFPPANAQGQAAFPGQGFASSMPNPARSYPTGGGMRIDAFGVTTTRDFEKLPPLPRTPEVNLVDTGETFVAQFELPGVRKEDLEIFASERSITITAESRRELDDGALVLGESTPVVYRRSIQLPSSGNTSQCKASLRDGFLTLKIPKREPSEGPRRLDVAYS